MIALRNMRALNTLLMRDSQTINLLSAELVPGDMVLLEAGNIVPADIRISEAFALRMDESSLTGESEPVDKTSNALPEAGLGIGDQTNLAFKGTLVTNGRGRGIVVGTGMDPELGKIAGMLDEKSPSTPLQIRLNKFGKKLSVLILGICAII